MRQSGNEPAKHGRISQQGPGEVRGLLVEAARHAGRTAGPLRAFFERLSARRGGKIATVAVARKLVIIAWHLLTRGETYAYMRPAHHAEEIRKLELAVGVPRQRGVDLRLGGIELAADEEAASPAAPGASSAREAAVRAAAGGVDRSGPSE